MVKIFRYLQLEYFYEQKFAENHTLSDAFYVWYEATSSLLFTLALDIPRDSESPWKVLSSPVKRKTPSSNLLFTLMPYKESVS
jgi:hypothetical protein